MIKVVKVLNEPESREKKMQERMENFIIVEVQQSKAKGPRSEQIKKDSTNKCSIKRKDNRTW